MQITNVYIPPTVSPKASSRTNNRFEHLHKVSYDNVTPYLEKKQQRLKEQQLKRTKSHKTNSTKKLKKETL